MIELATDLYGELWVSLASLLRSYTAVHGLNRKEQATVELGEDRIIVRAGVRRLELERSEAQILWAREDRSKGQMQFTIDGKLQSHAGVCEVGATEEEMDMQAESWARELMR